jgi:hypothetical protein
MARKRREFARIMAASPNSLPALRTKPGPTPDTRDSVVVDGAHSPSHAGRGKGRAHHRAQAAPIERSP